MIGPEEDWENRKLWDEEKKFERPRLTQDEISDLKADEIYEDQKESL